MTVLVLHDLGAPDGGAAWRAAAPRGWVVLDLPGHGRQPAPRQGHYDPMAAVTLARWSLGDAAPSSTVAGVGHNAHAALILAAGKGCGRVVVVDGLWGGMPTPAAAVAETYATIRAVVASGDATRPPAEGAVDPRAQHGYGVDVSEAFLRRFWGAVSVPVLVIETPVSATPPEERIERTSWFGGPTTLVEAAASSPEAVIEAISSTASS